MPEDRGFGPRSPRRITARRSDVMTPSRPHVVLSGKPAEESRKRHDGPLALSVLYMIQCGTKATNDRQATDRDPCRLLPHGRRHRANPGVAAKPAAGRPAGDRDRPRHSAIRLAGRDAPLCRSLGGGLWEVRSFLPSRRIARLVFFVHVGRIGVVHGFIKKTQKTPPEDIALARKRMQEMRT